MITKKELLENSSKNFEEKQRQKKVAMEEINQYVLRKCQKKSDKGLFEAKIKIDRITKTGLSLCLEDIVEVAKINDMVITQIEFNKVTISWKENVSFWDRVRQWWLITMWKYF